MTKYVLATRHCQAAPAAEDLDRVLTEAGEEAARALGNLPIFKEFAGAPLFGSPAIRTRQTLAHAFRRPIDDIKVVDELYPDPKIWPGNTIEKIYAEVGHAPYRAYLDAEGGSKATGSYGGTAACAIRETLTRIKGDRAAFAWHGALIQAAIDEFCWLAELSVPEVVMNKPLEPGDGFVLEFDGNFKLISVEPYFQ